MTLTKQRKETKEVKEEQVTVFRPNQFQEKYLTWTSLIQTKNRRRMTNYEQSRYDALLADKVFQKQLTNGSRI